MTAIVAVAHAGKVWIGGDSAGVSGWSLTPRKDSKVFVNGEFAMGFTTSFRMGQLLRWSFAPPLPDRDVDDACFMTTEFVDAVRQCLKVGGYSKLENNVETGGTFLVGWRGQIWEIESDFQVGQPLAGFSAVGAGHELALGALHATYFLPPDERVRVALGAAERFNAAVRAPFVVVREP